MTSKEEKKLRKAHVAPTKDVDDRLAAIAKAATTLFKDDSIIVRMDQRREADLSAGGYSTGYAPIDDVLTGSVGDDGNTIAGTGIGFPRGRMIEVYGPEACMDSHTFVRYTVLRNGKRSNHKGGTIAKLYERFHKEKNTHSFTAPCMNEAGAIFANTIVDVVRTGQKRCLRIADDKGHMVVATADHKFWTGSKYVPAAELAPGSTVYVHDNTPFRGRTVGDSNGRVYLNVKYHPVTGEHEVTPVNDRTKVVRTYKYHRVAAHRAVVEASINNISLLEYLSRLNEGKRATVGMKFLPRTAHVHHINEDVRDNRLENLLVVDGSHHNRHHAFKNHNKLRFVATPSTVLLVEDAGVRETYDIRMLSPNNNYVADGFVVHNSGKTSLLLMALADCQRKGGIAAYIDVEHALDTTYAAMLGVDCDKLLISQPDTAEDALELARFYVKQKVDIIGIDSVAALVPKDELEADFRKGKGAGGMALQARLMSQACRRLTGLLKHGGPSIVWINQIRMKLGVMFGNPETVSGGNALKFYASIRCDLRKVAQVKKGGNVVGVTIRMKTVKNKCAQPFREVYYNILFNKGIKVINKSDLKKKD